MRVCKHCLRPTGGMFCSRRCQLDHAFVSKARAMEAASNRAAIDTFTARPSSPDVLNRIWEMPAYGEAA